MNAIKIRLKTSSIIIVKTLKIVANIIILGMI